MLETLHGRAILNELSRISENSIIWLVIFNNGGGDGVGESGGGADIGGRG